MGRIALRRTGRWGHGFGVNVSRCRDGLRFGRLAPRTEEGFFTPLRAGRRGGHSTLVPLMPQSVGVIADIAISTVAGIGSIAQCCTGRRGYDFGVGMPRLYQNLCSGFRTARAVVGFDAAA